MKEFNFYLPTKIYFGSSALDNLEVELKKYGSNILITYGGGSIKRNGLYDKVVKILNDNNKNIFELSGITPNPRTEKVNEGIKICKENNVDLILAIGGGSTIDCSKAIAIGSKVHEDFWDKFYIKHEKPEAAIPVASILTLAGTGSEMNSGSVISNWDMNMKKGFKSELMIPKFSILNPEFTYTVPKEQLIYGTIDIISHIFEQYFSEPNESNVSDDVAEALLKNIIHNFNIALDNPNDYNARSNLMWDSTLALNGLIRIGKKEDWQTHQIEHALSAFYDIPHGAGLSIVHPNTLEYVYKKGLPKFVRFAKNIWNIDPTGKTDEEVALEGIRKTKEYFKQVGAPTTLKEVGIDDSKFDSIADTILIPNNGYMKLEKQDIINILRNSL